MLNERDRRCAAGQLMVSTDPSYDNRTIASTLKMQIWIATNNRDVPRVIKTKFRLQLWSLVWFQVRAKSCHSHLRSRLESQHQSVPGCAEECGDPLVQSGGRCRPCVWQQDSAPAHKSKETQAWLQKECYDFVPFSHWSSSSPDLNPLDFFVLSYVENITNTTSHNTKASLIAAIRRVFAGLPPALIKKACSQFRIRIKAVIEAEGGYIE